MQPDSTTTTASTPETVTTDLLEDSAASMVEEMIASLRGLSDLKPLTKKGKGRADQDPAKVAAKKKKARKKAAASRRRNRGR